ncbi:MAG: hypothetical protein QOI41_2792 [Myxococcales bacterium]|nr:hypothetical protein [Myxococcales bacterium]
MMSGALLMVSFGTACGLADVGAGAEGDGGADTNGSVDGTSGASGAANGGNTSGGGISTQGGNANDGAGITYTGDAGVTSDGGLPASKTPVVQLGTARTFAILSKGGISTVPTAVITGDLGISPAAATYITGFSLTADGTNVFSTSTQVIGKVYAADYAVPTPSNLTSAISDMELAFTEAAGRAPDVIELGAGDIGGLTLVPGVYKWSTAVLIPKSVTLDGNANDVWIFQIAQTLGMSSATSVVLKGGALPKNVFWNIAGAVDLDTTAHLEGVILAQTSITLGTGASIKGSLLAQTSVDLAAGAVVQSSP